MNVKLVNSCINVHINKQNCYRFCLIFSDYRRHKHCACLCFQPERERRVTCWRRPEDREYCVNLTCMVNSKDMRVKKQKSLQTSLPIPIVSTSPDVTVFSNNRGLIIFMCSCKIHSNAKPRHPQNQLLQPMCFVSRSHLFRSPTSLMWCSRVSSITALYVQSQNSSNLLVRPLQDRCSKSRPRRIESASMKLTVIAQ